jgi:beta-RFAP synthase
MEHSPTEIEVTTPSRLHFGMFSFGRPDVRQFGGVGMMTDRPGLRLRLSLAERFHTSGPHRERVEQFAGRWAANSQQALPPIHLEVLDAPPQHAGLGVGTQLALATAAGLNVVSGRPRGAAVKLAALVERGLRSSVGIYGFDHGGLIVERGKLPGETISPLHAHLAVPSEWRVVLVQPEAPQGLSGVEEQQAFAHAAAVSDEVTAALWSEVETHMLPALRSQNFNSFAESVTRFGHAAGLCFAEIQGGAYNGPLLTEIVAAARRWGATGVGQSSWGSTIFCLLRNEDAAREFVERMRRELSHIAAMLTITHAHNQGALLRDRHSEK